MAAVPFNVALGLIPYYASLPASPNDALTLVPLAASGLQALSVIRDHDTLAAVLAANTEQTTIGRINITSGISITVDDTGDTKTVDFPNQVWVAATGAALGAVIVAYTPNTSTSTDSQRIPLTCHEFAVTPSGINIVFDTSNAVYSGG